MTNLFIGLHRDLRGEHLAATRFIQGYTVDRLITVLDLLLVEDMAGVAGGRRDGGLVRRDPYDVGRRVERPLHTVARHPSREGRRDLILMVPPGRGSGSAYPSGSSSRP
ncbi:MAG: hypothetical protein ABI692_09115 [Terracoccus sp.]